MSFYYIMFGFVCSTGFMIIQYYFIIPSLFLSFHKCSFFLDLYVNIIVLNHPFFPPSSLCLTSICCVKLRFLLHGLSHTPLCVLPHYDRGYTWPFDPESCAGEDNNPWQGLSRKTEPVRESLMNWPSYPLFFGWEIILFDILQAIK